MTENDRKLIAKAKSLSCTLWYIAYDLAELADTREARIALENIGKRLAHMEEYHNGLL